MLSKYELMMHPRNSMSTTSVSRKQIQITILKIRTEKIHENRSNALPPRKYSISNMEMEKKTPTMLSITIKCYKSIKMFNERYYTLDDLIILFRLFILILGGMKINKKSK